MRVRTTLTNVARQLRAHSTNQRSPVAASPITRGLVTAAIVERTPKALADFSPGYHPGENPVSDFNPEWQSLAVMHVAIKLATSPPQVLVELNPCLSHLFFGRREKVITDHLSRLRARDMTSSPGKDSISPLRYT
ncbi:MAG TPA: hypothetical protein VI750_07620 [Pyrinomonadaceae bacterium]|nr:hypothetical protein [Pyrinomonadaceae bacterium]